MRVTNIVAAHRGASRFAPENTLSAFERALASGARAFELDVHLTRDEQVVVIHDRELDRTTDGTGPVNKLARKEIEGLDAGSWFGPEFAGERVPFLEEVLELTDRKTRLHVELKSEHGELLASRVIEEVRRYNAADRVIAMSFDLASAMAAKRAGAGAVPAIAIVGPELEDQFEFVRSSGLDGLNQPPRYWRPETMARFREHDLLVHGSLVNDPSVLSSFFARGGNMADSDEPALFGGPPPD